MKSAWTYSQLEQFESCPKKFYHLRVARDVVEPPSEHIRWGNEVHEALERRIMQGIPLPEGMQQWEPIMAKIERLPGEKRAEQRLALDRNFKPTSWRDSWTRGIADLVIRHGGHAAVFDHKTGKRKPTEQLDLYALYVFAHYPEVEQVSTAFVWLKEQSVDKAIVFRSQAHEKWQHFLERVAKLEDAYVRDSWPARPSGLCRAWCPVLSCEFNGKRG